MPNSSPQPPHDGLDRIPRKGSRIELLRPRAGVRLRGSVYYVDELQILVKWDNGRSQSLRPGADGFRLLDEDSG